LFLLLRNRKFLFAAVGGYTWGTCYFRAIQRISPGGKILEGISGYLSDVGNIEMRWQNHAMHFRKDETNLSQFKENSLMVAKKFDIKTFCHYTSSCIKKR
jgi:hypothetical protein